MVFFAFLSYNIYLWFITSILNISVVGLFLHQFYVVILFRILGLVSVYITKHLIDNLIASFVVSGMLYTLSTCILIGVFPGIIRLSRQEIFKVLRSRW